MSETMSKQPGDTTFRNYNTAQGANYAKYRRDYHPRFYQLVLDHHKDAGGQFDTVLDVGTGPGLAVRTLGQHFKHAIGIDPSEGMVNTAHSLGGVSSTSETIRFEVSSAEELGTELQPPVLANSVDLITAATSAHWFDMPAFWQKAAQVLKPGGSVALWSAGHTPIDTSIPGGVAVQAILDKLEDDLTPYLTPGNLLTRSLYVGLPLPWTLEVPVTDFEEASFFRKEWGTQEGQESAYTFYNITGPANLTTVENLLGTSGPIVRWREANSGLAGTDQDLVRKTSREVEHVMLEAGVEKEKVVETLNLGSAGVLLIVKKRR
jgi:SAM-dependent methyltransferase